MRDTQRSKVYKWERRWITTAPEMTLAECEALTNRIAKFYRIRPPWVTDGRGCRRALYFHNDNNIALPVWSRQPIVVCHEMAHSIVGKRFGRTASHGREFVGVAMYLYKRYCKIDEAEMVRRANEMNIDFISPRNCTPKKVNPDAF